ncbi:DUF1611 domain-containing protein [Cypionkella psychrotolerans]|uniref:DUF1611 domain-containing protein n=1 Tax=Cypionkella psychrotolerans TaxID=1678131 RepID=UPI000AB07FF6|nr:DUF1611 domain-containing protein [Cypionkella psychrotolerans]
MRKPGFTADLGLPDMDLKKAAASGAKTLGIGTSPQGGQIPAHWVARTAEAMEEGLDVASGLHVPLRSLSELADVANGTG